jgi:predicted DNA-binding transcriptional regulator AlpA
MEFLDFSPDPLTGELPRIIQISELSQLINKTETTIRTCATNAKYLHLIPRPFKLPASRRLCWLLSDVLVWLGKAQQVQPTARRRRGRPTKTQTLARQHPG